MGNIITYVEENGLKTFEEMAFNEVDSLVFSQLSYLYYDEFIIDIPFTVSFETIRKSHKKSRLNIETIRPKQNEKLINAVCRSKRFKDVSLGYYVNDFDTENETQFSAVVFKLTENLYYIAYRGTDASFVGWKEDMNMAFMTAVPSQLMAEEYLRKIIDEIPDGQFIVGGHSKGGNMAVYAAAMLDDDLTKRLIALYNHDGPGFRNDVLIQNRFKSIESIVQKTVPQSSIIGMILQEHGKYSPVRSNSVGILQHDPFFWEVSENSFVHLDETTEVSKFADLTLNEWLNNMDDETRKAVVESLYTVISATKSFTFKAFRDNFKSSTSAAYGAIKNMDPEAKEIVQRTFKNLVKYSKSEMRNVFGRKFEEVKTNTVKFRRKFNIDE